MSAVTSQTMDFFGRRGMASLSLSFINQTQSGFNTCSPAFTCNKCYWQEQTTWKASKYFRKLWLGLMLRITYLLIPFLGITAPPLSLLSFSSMNKHTAKHINSTNKGGLGLNRWSLKGWMGQKQPAKQTNLSAWSSPSPSICSNWLNYHCIIENAVVILKLLVTTSWIKQQFWAYQPWYKCYICCHTHTCTQRASL